jgi:dihydrofolate reductase
MSSNTFTLTIHMVQSLDGMIAKKDNSVSWFDTKDYYEKGIELTNEEMAAFIKTIDCYVMGAHTYEHALELSKNYGWVYGDVPTFVLSKRNLPVERPNVEIYQGGIEELVNERLKPNYNNVWMAGGAILAKAFIQAKLADEIRLTVLPIILGDGLPFFETLGIEQPLHLIDVRPYKSGMVELHYGIKK